MMRLALAFDSPYLLIPNKKSTLCVPFLSGGAGDVIVEHCLLLVLSELKASSISSNGMLSMLNGFLLALIIKVK